MTPKRRCKGCGGAGSGTGGGGGPGPGAHACPRSPSLGRRRQEAAEEEIDETPQEKKLRLAKQYLEELRQYGESRPAPGAGAPAERPRALRPALTPYVCRRGGAGGGGGGGGGGVPGGSHRRPAEGGRGKRAGGRLPPIPVAAAGSAPLCGAGAASAEPLLLPQLEQKGQLQRLVAKDVSAQCWGAAGPQVLALRVTWAQPRLAP